MKIFTNYLWKSIFVVFLSFGFCFYCYAEKSENHSLIETLKNDKSLSILGRDNLNEVINIKGEEWVVAFIEAGNSSGVNALDHFIEMLNMPEFAIMLKNKPDNNGKEKIDVKFECVMFENKRELDLYVYPELDDKYFKNRLYILDDGRISGREREVNGIWYRHAGFDKNNKESHWTNYDFSEGKIVVGAFAESTTCSSSFKYVGLSKKNEDVYINYSFYKGAPMDCFASVPIVVRNIEKSEGDVYCVANGQKPVKAAYYKDLKVKPESAYKDWENKTKDVKQD